VNVARPASGFLIPDLCSAQAVLFLVLISVLLALTLVLFVTGLSGFDWIELGRVSLFILWNMLLSAALLCALRNRIAGWPLVRGACLSYGIVLGVCAFTSVLSQWSLQQLGTGRLQYGQLGRDLLIAALLGGAALRYFHLQGELIKHERSELSARIQSLQARIRPHFLFNSMNIIASLIPDAPEQAERAVEDLAELFRASLREGETTVALSLELDLCERYLRLEKLRIGERLKLRRNIGDIPASARVPPLCVQPLLENAVYHGIQPLPEGGCVTLDIGCSGRMLCVDVVNPLPQQASKQGTGIALANIRDRLGAIYGARASLDLRSEGGMFRASLRIPLEDEA
jgi:two-component system sensor histidine kinase AlgZ